jgi:thioesterase domain-containing protein
MNVLELPFINFVGINDADEDEYLLELPESDKYYNHLETVHAGALFTLAEASSGKYLLIEFADLEFQIIPLLRKATVKYSKPVEGIVKSRGTLTGKSKETIIDELTRKSRTLIDVEVTLFSETGEKVMSSEFQWFVSMAE